MEGNKKCKSKRVSVGEWEKKIRGWEARGVRKLERKRGRRKKVRGVTLLRKARREHRRGIERERNKKEISRIFYILGYPCLILLRLRKKQNPIIKECEGNRKEAREGSFHSPNKFL